MEKQDISAGISKGDSNPSTEGRDSCEEISEAPLRDLTEAQMPSFNQGCEVPGNCSSGQMSSDGHRETQPAAEGTAFGKRKKRFP